MDVRVKEKTTYKGETPIFFLDIQKILKYLKTDIFSQQRTFLQNKLKTNLQPIKRLLPQLSDNEEGSDLVAYSSRYLTLRS